jgi:proteasome accessory factor B
MGSSHGSRPRREARGERLTRAHGLLRCARMDRLERLLDLVHVLSTSPAPVSLAELREVFPDYAEGSDEAVRRKFERDKAELAGIGIVLRYTSADDEVEPGYLVDAEASYLPEVALSAEDRALLAQAGRAALAAAAFPYRRALRLALGKLGVSASRLGERDVGAGVIFRHPAADLGADEGGLLSTVLDAIARRKRMAIEYEARDGTRSERELDGYGVFARGGGFHLVGFDRGRGAVRVLRLAGMKRAAANPKRPGEADYDIPEGVDPRSYARSLPHLFEVHEELEARIWLDPDIAFMFEPAWGRPDDQSVFTIRTTNVEALVDRVLFLGERAELLAPASARESVVRALEAVLAAHQTP